MEFSLAGLVFLAVFAAVAYFAASQSNRNVSTQLAQRIARPRFEEVIEVKREQRVPARGARLRALLNRIDLVQRFEQSLWQAGIYRPVSDLVMLMIVLFGAGGGIGITVTQSPLLAIAAGALMALTPLLYIRMRRQKRLDSFVKQLPFALDLIKSSIEAGHSLLRGFQVVVGEFQEPLAGEFRSVIEQSRLGLPLPRAMEEMLKRVPDDDLRLLVVAIQVQSEVGSSLAHIIGRLSEIVRMRQRIQQQVRALTAQSRLSGWIIGFLPVVMLAAFGVMQPEYIHTLFYDPSGLKILKVAIVLDVLAFLTIRKLIKVKF